MSSRQRLASFATLFLLSTAVTVFPSPLQQPAPETLATLAQSPAHLRWKLEATDWDFGVAFPLEQILEASPQKLEEMIRLEDRINLGTDRQRRKLHRTTELLFLSGSDQARAKAIAILRRLIELHTPTGIDTILTPKGIEFPGVFQRTESGPRVYEPTGLNAQRVTVLNLRDLTYEYAMLYLLSGEPGAAQKAKELLLRFAEVMPHWPLYDRNNRPRSRDDQAYLAHSEANGLWSVWNPLDFKESLPLLRAYDFIRPTLSEAERHSIENGIFIQQKELNDRLTGNRKNYDNLQGYRLPALILFGRVLERPDYVREAISYTRDLLRFSYTPDGFWREVTPSYHRQMSSRLLTSIPLALKGYTFPTADGQKEAAPYATGREPFEPALQQIEAGLRVLAMPDGTYLSINDAWAKADRVAQEEAIHPLDAPGLLGIGGVAKLGSNAMSAFLQYGGTRGHDHDSSLQLTWFAGGREVFSETTYQALPESGSSREWHSISASHHTVTVDESMNPRSPERLPQSLMVPAEGTPEAEESDLIAIQPTAAKWKNQGQLLLWRADSKLAQAMEAEREQTYPGVTSLFRRTVVLIPEEKGTGTLVEIFRVRGGSIHDYALRGGLDEPYTLKFETSLQPTSGTLYRYIELQQKTELQLPLKVATRYEDGFQVHSTLLHVHSGDTGKVTLLVGEAPAIRRLGRATFSMIRHTSQERSPLESCYIWVHEAGKEKTLLSAEAKVSEGNIIITLKRKGRTDTLFAALQDHPFEHEGWSFTGRLAYTREEAENRQGIVFQGGPLEHSGQKVANAAPSLTGELAEVTSEDQQGAKTNSILVHLQEGKAPAGWKPKLLHLDFGAHLRTSIPVTAAREEGDALRLTLAHPPGFGLQGGETVMTHAPGWAFKGRPQTRIDGIITP